MKKILFVAHMQSHIMNFHIPFIKNFQSKGYEVWVATKLDEKYANDCIEGVKWVDIEFTRSPFSIKIFKALNQLVKLMKETKFSLIHVHTPVGGVLGRIAAKATKNGPVIYTAHGFHFFKGAPKSYWMTYYPVEKIMSKYTDAIITMNNEDFENAKNKLWIDHKDIYKVNGVGVDISRFSANVELDIEFKKSLGLEKDDFVITIVAELSKRKNQIQIINAMKYLKDDYPDIKVLLVGDGELYEFYKKEINENDLSENVILLGYRRDVNKIMQISNLIGLFSNQEGLPKNLLEALASGKAIICTDVRGNNDLVIENGNGALVKLNDVQDTVEKLKNLYSKKEFINELEKKSINMSKNYSEKQILIEMENVYSKYILR
ncbi:MAG: glycosyltransferase family 4 protein [Sarcina sp.]